MKQSLQILHKVFKLEADRGYDNRAVVGGLNRILDSWESDARLDGLQEGLIQAVSIRLRDYSQLSESSRAEALTGLWNRIIRETDAEPISFPPPKIPPTAEEVAEIVPSAAVQPATISNQDEHADISTINRGRRPSHAYARIDQSDLDEQSSALNAPITVLDGVGPKHALTLSRLGLSTLRDMLYNFPRRYIDYSRLKPINRLKYGDVVTVIGTIQNITSHPVRGGSGNRTEAILSDGTGALRITWFNPWVAKRLHSGLQISVSGKIDQYLGRLVMQNPEVETLDKQQLSTNRIVPVYSLTAQITQSWMRRIMNQVVSHWAPRITDPLPENLRHSAGLVDLSDALLQMHFPDTWEQLESAQQRLAFDEIFYLQLGVLNQKRTWQSRTGRVFDVPQEWLDQLVEQLPFRLTGAQQRALEDICHDMASGRPMNRLLEGDVGSGKTIIAALAVAVVVNQGAQAALMAPTSILAEQHYRNMLQFLSETTSVLEASQIRLLIGATPETDKQDIRDGLANGSIKLVIGTHALIEDPVAFEDLELTVIDEQHRFGVEQRAALRSKGTNPHLLVMTATPIPRSLALTIYGDLDLSVIDEMPPGRQPIGTYVLPPLERERTYSLIRSQVKEGRQAFIIYPLVEESDKSEAMAAVEEYSRLQEEIFPNLKLGLMHGRLNPEEKDDAMALFRNGAYNILVSTSVVEVGVDVPNATVMLIEGANRFGLAQLHQFRGRVGRGAEKSYCLLIPETADALENERLQVMAQTNDGFVLAEHDLKQRGPGEFLGTRQSGYRELQLSYLTDVPLIDKARRQAQQLSETDPDLQLPEHKLLAAYLERFWDQDKADVS